ncbi:hypothetical protein GCM10027589_04280 [Actinocorallia lasiicapitis]
MLIEEQHETTGLVYRITSSAVHTVAAHRIETLINPAQGVASDPPAPEPRWAVSGIGVDGVLFTESEARAAVEVAELEAVGVADLPTMAGAVARTRKLVDGAIARATAERAGTSEGWTE